MPQAIAIVAGEIVINWVAVAWYAAIAAYSPYGGQRRRARCKAATE